IIRLRTKAANDPIGYSSIFVRSKQSARPSSTVSLSEAQQPDQNENTNFNLSPDGRISKETLSSLGLRQVADPKRAGERIAQRLQNSKKEGGEFSIESGQPEILNARSALSAALITTIGGRDNQFSEVTLIADWDGREDCAADREQKVDDFSFVEADINQALTRTGISEHTVANGFAENVYYYGDTLGNLWVGTDTNPGINVSSNGAVDSLRQVNIPALVATGASGGFTLLNPIGPPGTDCTDDQVTVTGIAVNPVADL